MNECVELLSADCVLASKLGLVLITCSRVD